MAFFGGGALLMALFLSWLAYESYADNPPETLKDKLAFWALGAGIGCIFVISIGSFFG